MDDLESLSRVLMGLSHPVQLIGRARAVDSGYDWPKPPQIDRQWLAVITAEDERTLAWRTKTLRDALEGVGLRCEGLGGDASPPSMQSKPAPLATLSYLGNASVYQGHLQNGSEYTASLVLRRWPREVAPGWLGQALSGEIPVDVAIHFQPQEPQRIARMLRRQARWQNDEQSKRPDAANALGKRDADVTREKLIARTDRPCKVAIVLTVRAPSRELLRQHCDTVTHDIGLALGDVRAATFEHDRGLAATEPTGKCDLISAYRTLDCASVASTWIFQPATINHAAGAEIGTTHMGSMLVRLDPFDPSLESFGGVVIGKVGAGKSMFLKLLARRLKGVEVLIVEQRTPAEYTGITGAKSFNLAEVPYAERADRLREYVSRLWETAKNDPRPRLLVLDELWSLLRDPALASLIEEVARIGRHHFLSLWIASQQTQEMVSSDQGLAVINNAAVKVYLKQAGPDLDLLASKVQLSEHARRFLRGAARGQALLDVGGMLVPVDIQASPAEHLLISTDPRERRAA